MISEDSLQRRSEKRQHIIYERKVRTTRSNKVKKTATSNITKHIHEMLKNKIFNQKAISFTKIQNVFNSFDRPFSSKLQNISVRQRAHVLISLYVKDANVKS